MTVKLVNNAWYDDLGDRWYDDDAHAIALLRVEATAKLGYVRRVLSDLGIPSGAKILDVGCGAGFISLPLAREGYRVKGVDLSYSSLAVARRQLDGGVQAQFEVGDAYELKDPAGTYDAVLLLDFLEHVERPQDVLAQAARVLRAERPIIFHTFNRTLLGYLVGVLGPHLIVPECPENLHVYDRFIKPKELVSSCSAAQLQVREMRGLRPNFGNKGVWSSLWNRRVHQDFSFLYTKILAAGYLGYAVKTGA